MDGYQPIDCGLHSRFELLAMQRRTVRLRYRSEADPELLTVRVIDVETRDGAEFLVVETEAGRQQLRLDRIELLD